jgi:hypothetical protein
MNKQSLNTYEGVNCKIILKNSNKPFFIDLGSYLDKAEFK